MKYVLLLILMCFPFVASGQKKSSVPVIKKNPSSNVYNIDVYTAYQERKPVKLSQVADDIEYIPLETTRECLIDQSIQSIVLTRKDIFIFDYNLGYRFSRTVKFINSIGVKGKGPGEFVKPMRMDVDTINRWVYFLDHGKVLKYDETGKHIETFSTGIGSQVLLCAAPGQFLIEDQNYFHAKSKDRFSMYFFSEKEKKLVSKFACEHKDKIPAMMMCNPMAYKYNNHLYLKDFWCDTIYVMDGLLQANSYAAIQKGRFIHRNVPDQSLVTGKESPGDKMILGIYQIHETGRFILLLTSQGIVVFDKKEKKTYLSEFEEAKINIENDLYGGALSRFPKIASGNTAVTYSHSDEFELTGKHSITDGRYAKYKKMVENCDPEDNPVLMLIRMKK